MLWRVGRGSRQSLHQLLHSLALANLLSPSSLHTPLPFPSLPLTWLRSFTLTRQMVHPVLVPLDYDDPITPDDPSPKPMRLINHQPVTSPICDLPLELLPFISGSHLRTTATQPPGKISMDISKTRDFLRLSSDSRKVSRLAQHMVFTSRPRRALLVLVTAHRCGCSLGKEVYESVARRLAQAREWRLISPLALLQKRQLGRHSARLLDWRIRALVEMSHFAHLDRALGWFEEEGLPPSRRTYHLLLSGYLRNRNIIKAMDVIKQMLKARIAIDSRTQATVISAYRSLGPDVVVQTRALDALKDADSNTSTRILNALLQVSLDTRDIGRVLSLIRHFDFGTFDGSQLSVGSSPPRHDGENAALSELIHSSSQAHASHKIPPDIATYTILLHHMAFQGDLISTLSLLEQLERSGLTPDSRFIAALVRLYFVVGRPGAAIDVVSAVCAEIEGSQAVFESIHLTPNPKDALPFPRILPKPTVEILNTLAAGLLRLRGIDGLQACLRLMQMCQVKPDQHTKGLLESHLINNFSLDGRSLFHLTQSLASLLRSQFRNIKRSGWNNTPRNQSSSLLSQGKSFDPTAGVHPVLSHQISPIRPVIQSLADRGVLADRRMFAFRIRHEAVTMGDMTAAESIFQMMLDRGLHPNEYHYAALMEGYAACGELAAAETVMNTAERGGVRVNCVMHTILIVGYARRKDPEQAMRIRPDVPAVDAITSVFFAVGAYRLARQTLLSLWPSVAPGRISSKKLSDRERRELSRTWLLTRISCASSQQESMMYTRSHTIH
ncbi:hypothetical protein B0F90DRAFT_1676943 [Multifurca ochricompacta]|uniref:Pentatricopeptide repeat-containing protein n=1 Tax=Multifurca ochricompacta TaxID=376703 RepID=A0AAD4MCR9_9AGAM|nr:hypothetical protein B0F90DRAFT_1676943 [Multifurca ochricompacta]